MASRTGASMEKDQQQWAVLKCPRCDSSNTKFCYYNNYSLSQPRHFCKACKRYWTRGGTLRNVPVGGGCRRKNKRVKRPNSCSGTTTTIIDRSSSLNPSSTVSVAANTSPQHHPLSQPQSNNHIMDMSLNSSLFYSLPSKYPLDSEMNNLQFPPRLHISNGFDHLNHLPGLPFSSDLVTTYNNPIFCAPKQPQQVPNHFQTLEGNNIGPYQISSTNYQADHQVGFSDPSLYWNSANSVNTSWHDPPNVGS